MISQNLSKIKIRFTKLNLTSNSNLISPISTSKFLNRALKKRLKKIRSRFKTYWLIWMMTNH